MNEAYLEGFMQKCAEMNVDPEALAKQAARGEQAFKLVGRVSDDALAAAEKARGPAMQAVDGIDADKVLMNALTPRRKFVGGRRGLEGQYMADVMADLVRIIRRQDRAVNPTTSIDLGNI